MDYSYYGHPPPQAYHLFGMDDHPQQTQGPQQDQFHNPSAPEHYDSTFQQPFPPSSYQYPTNSSGLVGDPPASPPDSFTLKHGMDAAVPAPNDICDGGNDLVGGGGNGATVQQANSIDNFLDDLGAADGLNSGSGLQRSSSEEKDFLTPAQSASKRKEQNRAAQRAFRERKERRVHDLEKELDRYKQKFTSLVEHNEKLQRQVAKFSTENEILRATSLASSRGESCTPGGGGEHGRDRGRGRGCQDDEPVITGPMIYSPTDYNVGDKNNKSASPAHRIAVNEDTGEKLLNASATWDLIVSYLSKEEGVRLDVGDIYEKLKGHIQCDGQGPVLEEGVVRQVIQDSIRGNSGDDLI